MSEARDTVERGRSGQAMPAARPRGGVQVLINRAGETETRQVLELDRTPWTLVIIVHEEAINQFPRLAYYGGVFSGREVSVRALENRSGYLYPMRATIDVAGCWRLRGFARFSIVHMILSVCRQWFGYD
jgi:hypothetical protein